MKITFPRLDGCNPPAANAAISEAEGVVWHEHFTFEQAESIAAVLERVKYTHVPRSHLGAFQRWVDILHALTNDSDACIVTAGETPAVSQK